MEWQREKDQIFFFFFKESERWEIYVGLLMNLFGINFYFSKFQEWVNEFSPKI